MSRTLSRTALVCSSGALLILLASCSSAASSVKAAASSGSTTTAPVTPSTHVTLPGTIPGLGGGGDDGGGGGDGGGDGGFGDGGGPGQGTPLTGADYDRATKAALAKYPGTIQTAEKLADGTIIVHVVKTSGGEVHVRETNGFVVTGVDNGPGGFPGNGGGDDGGGAGNGGTGPLITTTTAGV